MGRTSVCERTVEVNAVAGGQATRKSAGRAVLLAVAATWMLSTVGCFASFDMRKNIPWPEWDGDKPQTPLKVVAMWQDTVKSSEGRPAVRGFGGRVIFYGKDDNKTVKVEGDLDVYAFVENDRDPNDINPSRKFVFTADMLEKHYSENKLGHTYNFWLPWEEVGGKTLQITLVTRFTPATGGTTVMSDHTTYILPGLDDLAEQRLSRPEPMHRDADITPVGYFGDTPGGHRISVESVPLPQLDASSEFRFRSMSGPAQPSMYNTGSQYNAGYGIAGSGNGGQIMPGNMPYSAPAMQQYGTQYVPQNGQFAPQGNMPYQGQQPPPQGSAPRYYDVPMPTGNILPGPGPAQGQVPAYNPFTPNPGIPQPSQRWRQYEAPNNLNPAASTSGMNGPARTSEQAHLAQQQRELQQEASFPEFGAADSTNWKTPQMSSTDPRLSRQIPQAADRQPPRLPVQAGPYGR